MMPPTIGSEPPPDFKPKSRKLLVVAALVGLVVGALGTVGVTTAFSSAPNKPAPRAAPKVSAKPKPSPVSDAGADAAAAAPAQDPWVAKATEGDPEAVKAISALELSERTAQQIVALERAEAEIKRQKISDLVHKIELVPKLGRDRNTIKAVAEFADDARVAGDLVLALASLPGPVGPDLLYKVGPGTWRKSPAKQLASDALYAKGVRNKASPALGVYLDLSRDDNDCETVVKILERVKISGDRRSLRPMGRLGKKTGCGPKKRDDCWPCLRKGDLLKDATVAARKRKE